MNDLTTNDATATDARIQVLFTEIKEDLREIREIVTQFRIDMAFIQGVIAGRFGLPLKTINTTAVEPGTEPKTAPAV